MLLHIMFEHSDQGNRQLSPQNAMQKRLVIHIPVYVTLKRGYYVSVLCLFHDGQLGLIRFIILKMNHTSRRNT